MRDGGREWGEGGGRRGEGEVGEEGGRGVRDGRVCVGKGGREGEGEEEKGG